MSLNRSWRSAALVAFALVLLLARATAGWSRPPPRRPPPRRAPPPGAGTRPQTCAGPSIPVLESDRPAEGLHPLDDLTGAELAAVRSFLLEQPELALVPSSEATDVDNILFEVELLVPSKQEVLAFANGTGPLPARKAMAVLFLFDAPAASSRCMQVEVGPLPVPTYYKELRNPKESWPIHIHQRPQSLVEYDSYDRILLETMVQLDSVMNETAGGYTYNPDTCGDKCLVWWDLGPRGTSVAARQVWFQLLRDVEGYYLHPVGIYLLVDTSGTDASEWRVVAITYGGRRFSSTDELLEWYADNRGAPQLRAATPEGAELEYSTFNPRPGAPQRPPDGRPGPRTYEPAGKRFTVRGRAVAWMGWDFRLSISSVYGMRLWNVSYNGTRIVYELAVQQAYSSYGADGATSPGQAATIYFDNTWGIGASSYELVPGVDCPDSAVFFDFWHLMDADLPFKFKKSACVFEQDLAMPLRRHTEMAEPRWTAAMPSYALVVRSVATVYNYNYQFDYLLFTDGTIESRVQAFGYLQPTNVGDARRGPLPSDDYGNRLWWDVAGTVHDHILQWKVDLDVAGTSNAVQKDFIVAAQAPNPWDPEGPPYWLKRVQRTFPATEEEARLLIRPETPSQYMIINRNATNRYGAARGYRIDHSKVIHQLLPDDASAMPAASFSKYQITVTRHKDTEPHSATLFDQSYPNAPVLDFSSLVDGEGVVDTDLVAWVTSGTWHVPMSEDAPTSPITAGMLGFVLRPHNYFDEDEALRNADTVIIRYDEEGSAVVQDTGMRPVPVCVPQPALGVGDYTGASEDFEAPTTAPGSSKGRRRRGRRLRR